tara:strand:- start:2294 stop:3640 length:1347 start_codon:yes stop_codon:yes gene_type:complete
MNKKNCHYSCTLNEVCHEITVGFVGSMTQEYISEGIPLLRSLNIKPYKLDLTNIKYISKEFHQKIRKSALKKGDVVVVRTGQPGTSCVIPDEFDGLNCSDLVVARPNPEKIDSYYLAFYLNSMAKQYIGNQLVGAIQQHFNIRSAKEMIIHLPSLNEQLKISKVLNDLNTKIEVNNKINAELEAMAKLIYDYWFVQFDFPFDFAQGKPDPKGKPYKSSGGKMVYNKELRREIPEGWENGVLSDIADITMGQSPSGSSYNEEGEGTVFYQGSTDFGSRFPTVRKYTTEPSRMAEENDILLSVRAPVGTLNQAMESCCIGRGLAALREKEGSISFLWSQMEYFKQIFERRNASGTTFGSITKDDLFNLKLCIPKKEVLEEFKKIVDPFHDKIVVNSKQNQKLSGLRDWLLPMLMNGQVTVANEELGITNAELGNDLGMIAEETQEYKYTK